MIKNLFQLIILISLVSCSGISRRPSQVDDVTTEQNVEDILNQAEANATLSGRKILEESRAMIANQEVLTGGCWDFVNAVYDRTGFSAKDRVTVFKSKFNGPYVKSEKILPGDWLYFVNHSYSRTEHSAIFVGWMDESRKIALMASYEGEKRRKPANYKQFDLRNIYNIIRARE